MKRFIIKRARILVGIFGLILFSLTYANDSSDVTDLQGNIAERAPRLDVPAPGKPVMPVVPKMSGEFDSLTVFGDARVLRNLIVCGKIKNKDFEALESCCEEMQSCCDAQDERITENESCCDAQDVRITDNESCCDAQDVRITENESCCDVQDIRITENESCCDAQDIRITDNESCCDAQDIRITENESCCDVQDIRITTLESCCEETQSCCEKIEDLESCCEKFENLDKNNELVFTAHDMDNGGVDDDSDYGPNALFLDFYSPKVPILAWSMLPSTTTQEPISLGFEIPEDFDSTSTFVAVDIHILVDKNGGLDAEARLRVRADFKSNDEIVGEGFEQIASSSDFTVIEPGDNRLRHLRITVTLDNTTGIISPRDWGLLVFDRVALEDDGTEYNKNLYLTAVSFRYKEV